MGLFFDPEVKIFPRGDVIQNSVLFI